MDDDETTARDWLQFMLVHVEYFHGCNHTDQLRSEMNLRSGLPQAAQALAMKVAGTHGLPQEIYDLADQVRLSTGYPLAEPALPGESAVDYFARVWPDGIPHE